MSTPSNVFARRRRALRERVDGPILLMGNGERTRNIPIEYLPFRQDSTFLYFTGVIEPDAALLIDGEGETLFLSVPADDDALWHGVSHDIAELGAEHGFSRVRPRQQLAEACAPHKGALHTLAVPDHRITVEAQALSGSPLSFGRQHGSSALVEAVITLRRILDEHELDEMRQTMAVTEAAHRALMKATRPGRTEAQLCALFSAISAARGLPLAYPPICTVRGEVLHNFRYGNALEDGQLMLLDAGAESRLGYATDITRTWPVSGRFTGRQRAAYAAVLEANHAAIAMVRPGTRYRDIHLQAARVLARFLKDEGLIVCEPDLAVEKGAHAPFFPHGVGHLIGLDVHDLENFGDTAAYAPGRNRSAQFGLAYLRLDLDLETDMVVTIEPGFYVVPSILDNDAIMTPLEGVVDREAARGWIGFGGIRIEDDVRVTDAEPEVLSQRIPKEIADIEAIVGTEERLAIA